MRGARTLRGSAAVLLGAALGYGLFAFGVAALRVSGSSMEPTLHDGALVLVVRPGLDAWLSGSRTPPRGAVVVLTVPGSAERVVKRMVATEGQSVAMQDGAVLVDGAVTGARLDLGGHAGHASFPAVTVPSGHVFVLGDNRLPLASRDSRDFGPVAIGALRGRVLLPNTGR